jgi:hypothetical protein
MMDFRCNRPVDGGPERCTLDYNHPGGCHHDSPPQHTPPAVPEGTAPRGCQCGHALDLHRNDVCMVALCEASCGPAERPPQEPLAAERWQQLRSKVEQALGNLLFQWRDGQPPPLTLFITDRQGQAWNLKTLMERVDAELDRAPRATPEAPQTAPFTKWSNCCDTPGVFPASMPSSEVVSCPKCGKFSPLNLWHWSPPPSAKEQANG